MKLVQLLAVTAVSFLGVQSQAKAEGFPNAISFEWSQPTARFVANGPLAGFSNSSSYSPIYNVQFKAGNDVRRGTLTLFWSWPNRLDFSFYNAKTGSTCPGTAYPQGNQFVGTMNCQSGSHSVVIR